MMQLIDKGYFDYDFEIVATQDDEITYESTVRSQEEIESIVKSFGIGVRKKDPKEMNLEELQEYIIKQERYGS